jgi:hypothetical protein
MIGELDRTTLSCDPCVLPRDYLIVFCTVKEIKNQINQSLQNGNVYHCLLFINKVKKGGIKF